MKVFLVLSLAFCAISAIPTPDQDGESKNVSERSEQDINKINLIYVEKLIGKQTGFKPEEVNKFIKLLLELKDKSNSEIDENEDLKHYENLLGGGAEAHMITKMIIGVMKEYANRPQNLKITDKTEKFLHCGEILLETFSAIARHFNPEADILRGLIWVLQKKDEPSYAEKYQYVKEKYDL